MQPANPEFGKFYMTDDLTKRGKKRWFDGLLFKTNKKQTRCNVGTFLDPESNNLTLRRHLWYKWRNLNSGY